MHPSGAPDLGFAPSEFAEDASRLRILAGILLVALALRIAWALAIPVVPLSDPIGYDAFARNLAEHGVYGWTPTQPHAYWPPGTSMLYAAVYAIFGTDYAYIVGVNVLLSLLLIVSTARVACRYYGERVAIYATGLLAVWPTLVMYPTIIASELPYLTLTLVALDVWTSKWSGLLARGALTGALIGFAALVRPLALLLPLIYAGCIVLQMRFDPSEVLRQLRFGAIVVAAMACVIAPWTYRNQQLYGEFILISTNGGITLWMGNAPGSDGRFIDLPEDVAGLPDNEVSKILSERAIEYIKQEPLTFISRMPRKLAYLWGNESVGAGWNSLGITQVFGEEAFVWIKRFTQLTWALIFCVTAFGVLYFLRNLGFWAMMASPFVVTTVYHTVVHAVIVSQERYHLSFAAQIAVGFAFGLIAFQHFRKTRRPVTQRDT
jgi:hypothetical protein